jgi:preprotein translocase SecE subunit
MDKVVNFINSSVEEMKKVRWPTQKETIRLTGYVIGVSLGVGLFVMFFDYLFAQLVTLLLTR